MTAPYQLFDALEPAVEAALTSSIKRFGVIVPIVMDQRGRIIDGHHRKRIADGLGLRCEMRTRRVRDEDEAKEIARTLNEDRRQLPIEDRRKVVADLAEQGHSLRAIAAAVGVGKDTVANDIATEQLSTGRQLRPDIVRGLDGKERPATRPVDSAPDDGPLFVEGEKEAILDALHEEYGDDIPPSALDQALKENLESKGLPESKAEWKPTKPDLGDGVSHPARYSAELIPVFRELLTAHSPGPRVLDPFAGTGRIHELRPEWETWGVELEPEWAALNPCTLKGSALSLPFDDADLDAICTSPTYGNRLADHHNASDPERRRSYTHDLGRELHPDNSGAMHWGDDYRAFHHDAWTEGLRVLRPGGVFILNMCDHVREGLVQPVTAWHAWCLGRLGLDYIGSRSVATRKLRQGANGNLREQEQIHVFRKPG